MAKAHERILDIAVTCDESDDSVVVTSVTLYRDRQKLAASDGKSVTITAGAASASAAEVALGEVLPTPMIIRILPTFQA